MEKFVLEIRLSDDMRSPDDLAWALHRVASKVQGGEGTGKIRDLTGDFTGEFDIVEDTDPTEKVRKFLTKWLRHAQAIRDTITLEDIARDVIRISSGQTALLDNPDKVAP